MIIRTELGLDKGLFRGRFVYSEFGLCKEGVCRHFGIGRRDKFVFCVSDRRPSGTDYYELVSFFGDWRVSDTDEMTSLTISFNMWAHHHFSEAKRLYVWIEL